MNKMYSYLVKNYIIYVNIKSRDYILQLSINNFLFIFK